MATPVVTVASGGLPVVDVTATFPKMGLPVTEALAGRGMAVTKVASRGMPVTFSTVADYPAGGGGGFTPADLVGLIGWWDASVFASLGLVGANVLSWADQVAGGHTLGNGSSSAALTYDATGFNSLPTLVFNKENSLHSGGFNVALGTGNTLTTFLVGQIGAASDNNARLLMYYTGNNSDWSDVRNFILVRGSGASIGIQRNAINKFSAIAYDTPFRQICTINSSGDMTVYINGVASTTASAPGNWGSPGIVSIGYSTDSAASAIVGKISMAGIATGFTNSTVVAQLDTYLKNKWGL